MSLQVSSHLPKVKKQPPTLEAPAETLGGPLPAVEEATRGAGAPSPPRPLPPLGPTPAALSRDAGSGRPGVLGHGERGSRPPSTAPEDVEAFFMTQVCEAGQDSRGHERVGRLPWVALGGGGHGAVLARGVAPNTQLIRPALRLLENSLLEPTRAISDLISLEIPGLSVCRGWGWTLSPSAPAPTTRGRDKVLAAWLRATRRHL